MVSADFSETRRDRPESLHESEQLTYVLTGALTFTLDGLYHRPSGELLRIPSWMRSARRSRTRSSWIIQPNPAGLDHGTDDCLEVGGLQADLGSVALLSSVPCHSSRQLDSRGGTRPS
jgi:hypothetical protein